MLARFSLLLALLLALSACQAFHRRTPNQALRPGQQPSAPASALSAWLDPLADVKSAVRLTTPAGSELRQALYVIPAPGKPAAILLRLRDYSAREAGKPDPQQLQLLDPDSGAAQAVALAEGLIPVECVATEDASKYCVALLQLAPDVAADAAPLQLALHGFGAEPLVLNPPARMYPLGFSDAEHVLCRSVSAVQLDGGLPAFSLDWAEAATLCGASAPQFSPPANGEYFACHNGAQAGYTISYDPGLPGRAGIEYQSATQQTGKLAVQQWSYPYHVSYAPFAWLPPLCWADAQTLVTCAFLPDAAGVSSKANYLGLFRLLALDTLSGEACLIEDRVQPYLPIAAAEGVIFYTLEHSGPDGPRWELWASSPDGLSKHRLWAFSEAIFASVEDVLDGRRLLLHRQYIAREAGITELHSELLELGLDPLPGAALAELTPELDQPLKPLAEKQEAATSSDQAAADDAGSAQPPAPPESPWDGDGPPPIATP